MAVLKKAQVVPGLKVRAVHVGKRCLTDTFLLNAHLILSNEDEPVAQDEQFVVTKGPHQKSGVKLVAVERVSDGKQGAVYYTDFIHRCEPV
jgi:hypothetical protein